ncbi:ArsR/SmtB family transcription factor [Microbacterium sp. Leaf179]|uniref:ArsR/SmtB family transcription factor n=1 Tax=Microbacterium sp. Leaf179 TaxID=1736288 RepID=UPI000AE9876D|nr:metalloregulator ArsR/SmtB family transcription factor [Microbacterium sp. Leaf179]
MSTHEDTKAELPQDDMLVALRALSNPHRLAILQWLREPVVNFEEQKVDATHFGVCVSSIRKRCEISQSTASQFMATLADAGLVQTTRVGQWTYFARNEDAIERLKASLDSAL